MRIKISPCDKYGATNEMKVRSFYNFFEHYNNRSGITT